jgi:hypothetical protein
MTLCNVPGSSYDFPAKGGARRGDRKVDEQLLRERPTADIIESYCASAERLKRHATCSLLTVNEYHGVRVVQKLGKRLHRLP